MRILFDIILIIIGFGWCTFSVLMCDKDTLDKLLENRKYFDWIRGEEDERSSDESDN